MNTRHISLIGWILFGLIAFSVIAAVIFDYSTRQAGDNFALGDIMTPFVPLTFAFIGALIISRQPRNWIGLLMMLPGLSLFLLVDALLRPYLNGFLPPPESPSPIFLLILWFSNWNWLLLVFPLMFIMVLFPTGRPLTPRWGWLIYFGVGLIVLLVLISTFAEALAPGSGGVDWMFDNPVGFIKEEWINIVVSPFIIVLPIWVLMCTISLFIRFRRALGMEREQIKWLFFAAAIFALSYVPTFIQGDFSDSENIWNIFWLIGTMAIPIAIAFAILRYRLYDIDLIIRKTLVYGVITLLLALVYFGSVVLLEQAFRILTGQDSPVAIVISTLVIAALFTPLRRWVQNIIDRRFYRRKYDAQQALASFAATARDEVELEQITEQLLRLVQESMQPEQVSLWLRPTGSSPYVGKRKEVES